ncbi:DNA adenine methylase [Paracidovorax wautersii]|uniref:DNA adenine methylase n=1 Tax=Paracidovorax wautersii TaxID=1177982 RepID=A0A1I2E625_9BURK|nr:DNA adenine methylase [Paracidovorax wautersii]SFE88069.1 DNA adenine methylase [Paracidovorax wautersii]
MNTITRPALRYHGGKFRLAPWIMQFFPTHHRYVEPFGGAAGVLLRKPRCHAEIYNDLDSDITNFFRVVRNPAQRAQLIEACQLTPYGREEWELAYEHCDEPIERARRTAVRAAMGFGSAGATKGKTGFRIDTARAWSTAMHDWTGYPPNLAAIGERMTGVLIENRPAIDVMRQHDAPTTLHFVDPPYLHETRVMRGASSCYRHELTATEHAELLEQLCDLQGMVVLSGYPSDLYQHHLAGWTQHTTKSRISAGRGTVVRTESAWLNPACAAALTHAADGLFAEAAA